MTYHIIKGHDEFVATFVSNYVANVSPQEYFSHYRAIGIAKDDGDIKNAKLVAGVVFNEFRPPQDVRGHIAVADKGWANKEVLREIFAFPFEELGFHRITAVISKKNKKAQNIVRKMGFKYEGNLRQAMADGDDAIIYGILKEQCKWLKK